MEGWGRVPQALPGHTVPPPLPQDNPQLGDPVSSSRARWPIPDSGAGFESRGGPQPRSLTGPTAATGPHG